MTFLLVHATKFQVVSCRIRNGAGDNNVCKRLVNQQDIGRVFLESKYVNGDTASPAALALMTADRYGRPRPDQPSLDLAGQLGSGWTSVSADAVFDFSVGLRRIADARGGEDVPRLGSLLARATPVMMEAGCFSKETRASWRYREINGWEEHWEEAGARDQSDAMRKKLAEKYVEACLVDDDFSGTIREVVWDTSEEAWVAKVEPDEGAPKSYPVASLPKLMIDAVQPSGIVVVEGSRNGFADFELGDEAAAESDQEDDAPNEDDVGGPAPPTQVPAVTEEATDTTGRRRSTRPHKKPKH